MEKLTEWYSGTTKPTTAGVYQRRKNGKMVYSYWNGEYWMSGGDTVDIAMEFRFRWPAIVQNADWRGVK